MAVIIKNEVKYNHYYDQKSRRHFINGVQSVLHCHHYTTLYSQLAIDANETDLLKECARENFRELLVKYFAENETINTIADKIDIACQYYSLLGLGKMEVRFLGNESGYVELPYSHVDAGWLKKWGKYDKPVNYITAGFIEAMFEVITCQDSKAFLAIEHQSIAMGSEISSFRVIRR